MLPLSNKYFLVLGKSEEIQHPFNLLLFVAQVVTVSLFIFLFIITYSPENNVSHPRLFLQICTGYTIFIGIKFAVEKIIGLVFNIDLLINSYLYKKLSYRNLLTFLFFIGNILFFYVTKPTLGALFIFGLVVLFLNSIALFYSYKTNAPTILNNFFYFILYLCALEISPYIILYKALV